MVPPVAFPRIIIRANLAQDAGKIVPGLGTYAAIAHCRKIGRPAAVSIGIRPQFDGSVELVEAFLLDFTGDLYGRCLNTTTRHGGSEPDRALSREL